MDADNSLNLLTDLVAKAKAAGADAADGVSVESSCLSVALRMGHLDTVERSEGGDLGLRVLIGKRQAIASSSDRSPKALDELVERAVAMARRMPEDPFCGLAETERLAGALPVLDIDDPVEPACSVLIDYVKRAEESARSVEGVTNSGGAEAGWGRSRVTMAGSNGIAHSYWVSNTQLSASVLAGNGEGGMERDYDLSAKVYFSDLATPEDIGRQAGIRAVRRLGARKVKSARVPVVFDPRVSRSLIGHLASAVNGGAIARGTSFLKDSLGQRIMPPGSTIIDDPHRPRGLRSKPCDGEGVANGRRVIVEDGILKSWVLDLCSARQIGLDTTGHASRGTCSLPSPSVTNLWLSPGTMSPAELIGGIANGFYVTELIGMGVNGITGDYSRGAAGFWIENGELAYAVNEVTVAGNLKDMLLGMHPADDLDFRYGVDAPTVRIDGMTVAGA